jgi:hypothetical protein
VIQLAIEGLRRLAENNPTFHDEIAGILLEMQFKLMMLVALMMGAR